jgi:hypothetical protein
VLNPDSIQKETANEILAYPTIRFTKTDKPIEVRFVDLAIGKREWLVYSNYPISNDTPSRYSFEISDELLCSFQELNNSLKLKLSKKLFYPEMVKSYHGIAHTTRVLFAAFLLCNIDSSISDEEKQAIYYSAIIHDLGKTSDREGSIHGENSANKYHMELYKYVSNYNVKKRILNAVKYHSIEDKECPSEIRNDIIWKVLKDADALDRGRFNSRKCDKSYLRLNIFQTNIGNYLIDYMNELSSYTQGLQWDEPYNELVKCIKHSK